jgi:hypothetical protein
VAGRRHVDDTDGWGIRFVDHPGSAPIVLETMRAVAAPGVAAPGVSHPGFRVVKR